MVTMYRHDIKTQLKKTVILYNNEFTAMSVVRIAALYQTKYH